MTGMRLPGRILLPVALAPLWLFLAFMRLDNVFTRSNAQSHRPSEALMCILPNGIAAVPETARLLHHCLHRRSQGTMLTNGLGRTNVIPVLASGDIERHHNKPLGRLSQRKLLLLLRRSQRLGMLTGCLPFQELACNS